MKKTTMILAILLFSCMGMMAQVKVGKYKDWKKTIDLLEVKASYDFTGRKTVILLPVNTSDVKLPDKDNDNYKLVVKSLDNLTQSVATELQKNLQKQKTNHLHRKKSFLKTAGLQLKKSITFLFLMKNI